MRPIKTLVVDDNEAFRAGLVEYLQSQTGVHVVGEAENGVIAIALCQSLDPDLVLMDVSMPVMDGVEATKQIKKQGARAKVVFVTIHEQGTYRMVAESLHVDGFISKNSVRHDLPKILRKIRTELDDHLPPE